MYINVEKLMRRSKYYFPLIQEALASFTAGGNVIDIGCGPGASTSLIKKCIPSAMVTGIDIVDEYVSVAQQYNLNIDYIVADCYNTPFPNNTFDCCFALNLFEFLAEPVKALVEMIRITKKNGVICVIDIDYNKLTVRPSIPYLNKLQRINKIIKKNNGIDIHIGSKLELYFEEAGIIDYVHKEILLDNRNILGFENTLLYDDDEGKELIEKGFFKKENYNEMMETYNSIKKSPEFYFGIIYDCVYGVLKK